MHEDSRRFRLFLERLEQQGLDGFLITHPANLFYLFQFQGSTGLACVSGGEARLLVDPRYIEEASEQAVNCRAELAPGPLLEALPPLLGNLAGARFGFEAQSLRQAQFATLQKIPNGPLWQPHSGLIEELRQRKSPRELQILERNLKSAQQALESALDRFQPEWSEIEFAGELEYRMRKAGAEGFAFETIVASGPRASLPHGLASSKVVGRDPLLVDFGMRRDGYCTDLTRMRADQPEVVEIMRVVLRAREAAFAAIRPGVSAGHIDGLARSTIAEAGYGDYFGHSLGHGLGLEVHELPRIAHAQSSLLETGMVFTLEPGIYLPGRFGVRIEDVVVVEENGARWLSDPARP